MVAGYYSFKSNKNILHYAVKRYTSVAVRKNRCKVNSLRFSVSAKNTFALIA